MATPGQDLDRLIDLFPDVPAPTLSWEARDEGLWRTQRGGAELHGGSDRFVRDVWLYVLLEPDAWAATEATGEFVEDAADAEGFVREALSGEIAERRVALEVS